jgi:hypothetical protein
MSYNLDMMLDALRIDDQLRSFLPQPSRPGDLDLADYHTVKFLWAAGTTAVTRSRWPSSKSFSRLKGDGP